MSGWDILLIASVSIMGAFVAYLRNPQHKAFVLLLPIPFSLAALSLGRPVDATNVVGVALTFGFSSGVWFLHARCRWPIVPVIILCGAAYCIVGASLARLLPTGDAAFWCAVAVVFAVSVLLIRRLPHREEPHHRTPLPIYIKLPAIVLVVIGIVTIKQQLGGFMTVFPMMGTVAAYEARRSLWTILRRIPWVMLLILPLFAVMRLTQERLGLGASLLAAWPVYLLLLLLLRSHYAAPQRAHGPSCIADHDPVARHGRPSRNVRIRETTDVLPASQILAKPR